jgi:hypothetical protein
VARRDRSWLPLLRDGAPSGHRSCRRHPSDAFAERLELHHLGLHLPDARQPSAPWVRLAERLRESKRRSDCIAPLLSDALAALALPARWTRTAGPYWLANAAVAAKLRQFVPLSVALSDENGFTPMPICVKVSTRRP